MTAYVEVRTPLVNATRFRAAHEADWERLDKILTMIEKRGVGAVPDQALLVLPLLYRSTLSSLSVARETSLDKALVAYLEGLCTRAYFQIYGVPTSATKQLAHFFARGWPLAVQSLWKETLVCLLVMVVGLVTGYLLIANDPALYYSLMPSELGGGRDPSSSAADLAKTIYDPSQASDQGALANFSARLFANNAQVSIGAFALGFMFCVPTVFLILTTGLSIGALVAVFAGKGLGIGMIAWLTIHGTTELFAIVISGAAGFRIGLAVAFPGRMTRLDAAVTAGRSAAVAMGGTVIMLIVAALIEGIGRQTINSDALRFAIGGVVLVGWLVYFYMPRKNVDGTAA